MKYSLLLITSALAGLIAAELYVRATYDQDYTNRGPRWPEPYLGFSDFKHHDVPPGPEAAGYSFDGWLYFYNDPLPIKSLSERSTIALGPDAQFSDQRLKKVALIGASSALGDGVQHNDSRLPKVLDYKLKEIFKNSKVELKPFALRAAISSQERIILDFYVLPNAPEAVIFLHGFNDLNHFESLVRPGDPYHQGMVYAHDDSILFSIVKWSTHYSKVAEMIVRKSYAKHVIKAQKHFSENISRYQNFKTSLISIYLDNISNMSKRCHQEQVSCFFVLQPIEINSLDKELSRQIVSAIKDKYVDLHGQIFLDFTEKYGDHPEYFVDPVHMNDQGQKVLAEDLARALFKHGL